MGAGDRRPRPRPTAPRRDRQVVRVLAILKLLVEGGQPAIRTLATRFRVRRETIYRDLHTLEAVGYPLTGPDDSGELRGRPRLAALPGAGGPPLALTKQEVAAVVWAVKASEPRQPFRAALSTALPKLQTLGGRQGQTALAIESALGGWDRGIKDYRDRTSVILTLVRAMLGRQRCRIVDYRSPLRDRPTTFLHDPWRLLAIHGGLYSLGTSPVHGHPLVLAVERIGGVEPTGETFEPDPALDVKRYEAEAFGVTWEPPMTVVVRFSADQAPFVREREWHPTQRLRVLPDGRVELTFRAGGRFEIVRWVLGWGAAAEVVRPLALRREVAAALARAAAIYRPMRGGLGGRRA